MKRVSVSITGKLSDKMADAFRTAGRKAGDALRTAGIEITSRVVPVDVSVSLAGAADVDDAKAETIEAVLQAQIKALKNVGIEATYTINKEDIPEILPVLQQQEPGPDRLTRVEIALEKLLELQMPKES